MRSVDQSSQDYLGARARPPSRRPFMMATLGPPWRPIFLHSRPISSCSRGVRTENWSTIARTCPGKMRSMSHPDASVARLDQVHGTSAEARGGDGIRETMASYIGLKPPMDVVVHHTTIAGDFAMCRSQWRITGTDTSGQPLEVHHHGIDVMRRLPNGEWVFFIDHPWGRTRRGQSNVRRAQSRRTAATRSRHAQLGSRGQAHISRPREIAWDSFIHGEAEGAVAAGASADVVVPQQA
jgi:ketosteroid isomerase-like protein